MLRSPVLGVDLIAGQSLFLIVHGIIVLFLSSRSAALVFFMVDLGVFSAITSELRKSGNVQKGHGHAHTLTYWTRSR